MHDDSPAQAAPPADVAPHVPAPPRHPGRPPGRPPASDARWALFLRALGKGKSVTAACHDCKLNPHTVYKRRRCDTAFMEEWVAAIDRGTDLLEDHAVARAFESDTVLMFLLRGRRAHIYGNRVEVSAGKSLTADELAIIRRAGELDPDAAIRFSAAIAAAGSEQPVLIEGESTDDGDIVDDSGDGE